MTQIRSNPLIEASAVGESSNAMLNAVYSGKTVRILAGKLYDPYEEKLISNQVITVSKDSGLILSVKFFVDADLAGGDDDIIDLRHLTVLAGFVDAHVHLFLHSYEETSADDQQTKESLAERTIRATVHARKTLMAGYTTVRDLGTEGAEDADVALRKLMSGPNAIIPGPRYFIANRAIVSTGSYGPKSSIHPDKEGTDGVMAAEVADGKTECIKAVRRQIGAGADWIKVYADYRTRSRTIDACPHTAGKSIGTFNREELEAIISTAHASGVKVSAHAQTPGAVRMLLELGVDSIEHGAEMHLDPSLIQMFAGHTTTWVPTLATFYKLSLWRPTTGQAAWEHARKSFQTALQLGMGNIACGGDTGAFAHGENALEMKVMVRLGADWRKVLRWGTLGGWEVIRPIDWRELAVAAGMENEEDGDARDGARMGDNEVRFGCLRRGWAADIIAVEGDFEVDFEKAVDSVQFVMKAGRVYKMNAKEVV